MKKLLKFFCQIQEKTGLFRRQNRSPSKTSIGRTAPAAKDHTAEVDFRNLFRAVGCFHPAKNHTGESIFPCANEIFLRKNDAAEGEFTPSSACFKQ
ncbi:MAG: hypothetical protein J6Y54_08520 [Lentisphaeria bacterium]|nr:hypothetical protein [Lentisphaeria bacterium]